MRPADRAWLGAAFAVTVYEITAVKLRWELLSGGVMMRRNHPIATDCAISFVALHLRRRWPPRLDPLAGLANLFGRT